MTRLNDSDYSFIYSRVPRLCVDLLFDFGNRILIGRRAEEPFMGRYALPGGRIQFGESLSDALDRVARTEVGLAVNEAMVLDVCEFVDENRGGFTSHSVSIAFVCKIEGAPSLTAHFTELATNRHVSQDDILPQHARIISRYLGDDEGRYMQMFRVPQEVAAFKGVK